MKKFLHPIAIFLIMAAVVQFILCGYYGSETFAGRVLVVIGLILTFASIVVEFFDEYYSFLEMEALKKQTSQSKSSK